MKFPKRAQNASQLSMFWSDCPLYHFPPLTVKKYVASIPNSFSNQLYWQLAPLSGTCHFVKKPKSQATYGTVLALLKAKKGIMVFAYFIFSATLFAMAVDVATEE